MEGHAAKHFKATDSQTIYFASTVYWAVHRVKFTTTQQRGIWALCHEEIEVWVG